MFNISQFFEKFKKAEDKSINQTLAIVGAIKQISGVSITSVDFEIKSEKIFIKKAPIFRNQILLYKSKIEDDLKSKNIYLNLI
jgi:hypothetical protein